MAVSSIKFITQAIITLLKTGLEAHKSPFSNVSPDPPSKEKESEKSISFYLFHIQESAHHRNFPPPGVNQPPIRYSPMGLNLFYQMTANSDDDESGTYDEQEMMGVAMKILHDYPEINDDTSITTDVGVIKIFDHAEILSLKNKGNRIKISLLPVNYNESVHYWTAGQEPMKLSAYYEVSMIFLEPEPATMYASRVLQYGTFVFTGGAPRITGSQSIIKYRLPGELTPREVITQPAQVPYEGNIDFMGTGFNGAEVELLVFFSRWPQPMKITRTTANWQLKVEGDRVTITINDTTLLFGLYAAQVNVIRQQRLPNGQVRNINNTTNQFPFTIIPQINPEPVDPNVRIVTVTGTNIGHPSIRSEILVFIGDDQYTPDSALPDGTFNVQNNDTIEIKLHAGLSAGILPLRILIAGAESAPSWVTIP